MDDGRNDFDFLDGELEGAQPLPAERLKGSDDWLEFEAAVTARPLAGVLGNEDEFRTDHDGGFVGMSFRFFDPETKTWSIYWADSRRPGKLDPPVLGSFAGDIGRFEGEDTLAGKPILMRFDWSRVKTSSPLWEQSFSGDDGKSWETNWVMEFERVED